MAAEELSNKEIAQALFVTVKTVEQHLGRVYRKLDISSRRQLGAALGGPAEAAQPRVRRSGLEVGLPPARPDRLRRMIDGVACTSSDKLDLKEVDDAERNDHVVQAAPEVDGCASRLLSRSRFSRL